MTECSLIAQLIVVSQLVLAAVSVYISIGRCTCPKHGKNTAHLQHVTWAWHEEGFHHSSPPPQLEHGSFRSHAGLGLAAKLAVDMAPVHYCA